MDHNETDQFVRGKSFFRIPWVEAPSATTARDGLGPLFSANTCMHCHIKNGAGVAVDAQGKLERSVIFKLSSKTKLNNESLMTIGFTPDPVYGGQLSVNGNHSVLFEGRPKVHYVEQNGTYDDGTLYTLRVPHYQIEHLNYGPLDPAGNIAPHIALALIGLGHIEKIPQSVILAAEDINDSDNDGISGKANWVFNPETNTTQLGRFAWKATAASIRHQSADAAHNDMGLTSPLFTHENCTSVQKECLEAPKGVHEFDLPQSRLDAIAFYLSHLKVPRARPTSQEAKALFEQLTCNRCHIPSYLTSEGVEIAPYSDFLLHDMGEALSDGHRAFLASESEWRTPPLWGVGLYKTVSGEANYLHDGRARSIEEAILWHGGEARHAKEAFKALEKSKRDLLVAYVKAL